MIACDMYLLQLCVYLTRTLKMEFMIVKLVQMDHINHCMEHGSVYYVQMYHQIVQDAHFVSTIYLYIVIVLIDDYCLL